MTSAERMTSAELSKEQPAAVLIDEVDRVRGLAAMDTLRDWLDRSSATRQRAYSPLPPRNAQERHIRDFGHRLTFGCCKEQTPAVESGELRAA